MTNPTEPTLPSEKTPMREESLAELLKSRYPHILPAVLDIYEKIYRNVPWERDPIRGGYRLMDNDLRFLDEISVLVTKAALILPPGGNVKENAELPPLVEEILPPCPHEEKVPQNAPISEPKRREVTGKVSFAALENRLSMGQPTVNQKPKNVSKSTDSISPQEDALRTGTIEIDIPVGTPNKGTSMASLAQRKQEIINARKKVSQ